MCLCRVTSRRRQRKARRIGQKAGRQNPFRRTGIMSTACLSQYAHLTFQHREYLPKLELVDSGGGGGSSSSETEETSIHILA